MTIVLDYDNDQVRIEDAGPEVTFAPVNEQTLNWIGTLLSDIFNRLADARRRDGVGLDLTVRCQSDGELETLEEW